MHPRSENDEPVSKHDTELEASVAAGIKNAQKHSGGGPVYTHGSIEANDSNSFPSAAKSSEWEQKQGKRDEPELSVHKVSIHHGMFS